MTSFDITQPFDFTRTVLIISGLWNTKKTWTWFELIHLIIVHLFMCLGLFLTMAIKLAHASKIEDITESLYMTLTMASMVGRVASYLVKRLKFVAFMSDLRSPLLEPKTHEENEFFEKIFYKYNRLRRLYLALVWGVIVVGCLAAALPAKHTKLPFPGWFPFDWESEEINFWIAFVYQTVSITFAASTNASLDVAYGYIFLQLSMYYRLISMRLQTIGYTTGKKDGPIKEIAFIEMGKCIRMHQLVTSLTNDIEDILSVPIFLQINVSGVVLCFTAFQLTLLSPIADTGLFILYFLYMTAMVVEVLLPCYYANVLTVESDFVSTAVYSSNWTEMPYEYRKLMFFFMESLKKPKVLLAGGYFRVGLRAMGSVIQTAYSLFAVIISMKKKNN